MHPSPEQLALEIVRVLQNSGHIAYFAGGCVRDRLMNRAPKDFDVATSAVPEQVLALFPRSQLVGAAFGVIIVRRGKAHVEVATFRSDGGYTDGRRPDSVSFTTPEIDARRRDFTCNGIFLDPVTDTVHDFVGGQADIAAKTLRAIGEPHHRFAEDHLRMMRAVRFAAKLDFAIDPATYQAIKEHAGKIRLISRERIGEELRMILEHHSRARGVSMLQDSGVLAHIWPERLFVPAETEFNYLAGEAPISRAVGIAGIQLSMRLLNDPPAGAELLRAAFMLSNEETAEVGWLLDKARFAGELPTMTRAKIKRILAAPHWPGLWRLLSVVMPPQWIQEASARIAAMQAEGVAPPPFVTGDDLIAMGAAPGRHFKGWLNTLYDRQLENDFSSRDAAMEAARTLIIHGRG